LDQLTVSSRSSAIVASSEPPAIDGRRRRSQQSRDRIVEAMLALVEEGAISPGAEEVAQRASVGLRSVFRHFKDMDSLYAEMAVRLSRVYESALLPFQAEGWRGQLFEAIDRRVDIFERLLPFKRAADVHRHESSVLAANHAASLALLRARLKPLLPPHLQHDPVALETLDMLLSVDTWTRLRIEQRLDPAMARKVIEQAVERLIG
jgi:AcrR family transcriptional regulator